MDTLKWLTTWFKSNCDGDWEHENQIQIFTVDNPGWGIKIGLTYTPIQKLNLEHTSFERNENDWYDYWIKDGIFNAVGDLDKLPFLLELFKGIVIKHWSLGPIL